MRALVQRVSRASVTVDGERVAEIGPGLLVLLGVGQGDGEEDANRLSDKLRALRVFDDAEGRMNEPLGDREVLCVSQFTLYAETRKGNRPSYTGAAPAEVAEPLYERFCGRLDAKRGSFGARMAVELVNDGPAFFWAGIRRETGGGRTPRKEMDELQATIEQRLSAREPDIEVIALERPSGDALRLYIDRPEGVDLADCERVTGHLRDLLEAYSIEVSSPGLDRPLTKPEHFQRFLGHRVRVRTADAIEGRRNFTGTLTAADDRSVRVDPGDGAVEIPLDRVRRSNLVPEPPEVPS